MPLNHRAFKEKSDQKLQRLDQRALKIADDLLLADIPRGATMELLIKLKEDHEKKGFLTEKQRELIRRIGRQYDDYEYYHDLCTKLSKMLEDGRAPVTAHNFIRSTVAFFNEKHDLTPLQLEQMIRIVKDVDDDAPGDQEKDPL